MVHKKVSDRQDLRSQNSEKAYYLCSVIKSFDDFY